MGIMERKKIAALVIVLVITAGTASVFFMIRESGDANKPNVLAEQRTYIDQKSGVNINHPVDSKVSSISEEDKKANIILRLNEKEGETPYLITLRSESGLRAVATLTRSEIIDMLMNNSERALPQRFTGFQKVSSRRYEHNGRKAGEIIFTYDSPVEGERIKQRFVVLVKDDDTAVYLAMQAREADFDEQNTKIFDPMAESLNFQ